MSEKRRSVVVTGGTRGIGKAIALRLASDGASRVVLGYMRNDKAAESAAEEIRAAGAEPVLVRGNIASERVIAELASHGPHTVVVHNAATGVIEPALETEDKHWDWTLNANSRAPARQKWRAARRLSRSLRSARSGYWRTMCLSGRQRLPWNRSCAISPSSSLRGASASTPCPVEWSRRKRSITFPIVKRCCAQGGHEHRLAAWPSPPTSQARSHSSARPTHRWCAAKR